MKRNAQAAANIVDLEQAQHDLQTRLLDQLADGDWHSFPDLFDLVPDACAEAVCRTVPAAVYSDLPDPLDYGRLKVLQEALQQLVGKHECEHREYGGQKQARRVPGAASSRREREDSDQTDDADLIPANDNPGPINEGDRTSMPVTTGSADRGVETDCPVPAVEGERDEQQPGVIDNSVPGAAKTEEGPERVCVDGFEFVLDPEFGQLLDVPSAEELQQLEENLKADQKVLTPLIRWQGTNILLDGYNRLRLIRRLALPFRVDDVDLADRGAAKRWIYAHQLGQRNITPEQMSYLRGKLYEEAKQTHGGTRRGRSRASGQNDHSKTDAVLASQFGVSPKTIRRDAQFANQVDTLVRHAGPEIKAHVLGKNASLGRQQVAEVVALEPKEQPQAVQKAIQSTKAKRKARPMQNAPDLATPADPSPTSGPETSKKYVRLKLSDPPEALARTLIDAIGTAQAFQVYQALGALVVLPEAPPQHHNTKPGKRKRPVRNPRPNVATPTVLQASLA